MAEIPYNLKQFKRDRDLLLALRETPKQPQRQDSLVDQMMDLQRLARHFGLYDADDWLLTHFFSKENKQTLLDR
jgi:hypothetical protein